MKKYAWHTLFIGVAMCVALPSVASAQGVRETVDCIWQPLPSSQEEGLLAERVDAWREGRMWHMLEAEDDYLLSGFEKRPGKHPWQGEHVGKWLHAATLAYEQTHDKKLLQALQKTVSRLIATQEPNGYLGTYAEKRRFYMVPADSRRWDTWTHRYNLYGLLTYDRFHSDRRVVEACRKMADLLIELYGEDKYDLTKYGTCQGISATTLLESIMMLYERTREREYLDFAEHIVAMSEKNPKLRLMGNMLEKGSVVYSGDGKAYQLMANLLGYLRLYRNTGDERYFKTVQNAWDDVTAHHLDVTGGPWGRKMPYNGNRECFALPHDYDPAMADIETCSTTTWVQLNLHLLELTGEARYAAEAERAVLNAILAAQHEEGLDWCYYCRANQTRRPYEAAIKCCSSSGPRALEMFARYLVGEVDGGVSFTSLAPCSVVLPASFGKARVDVLGNYPIDPNIKIRIAHSGGKPFAIEFRDPVGSSLKSVRINDQKLDLDKTSRGYYRIERTWTTGNEIALEYEYRLRSHIVTLGDKPAWVAFSYGPWALAQTTDGTDNAAEPFVGKDVQSTTPSKWLLPHSSDKTFSPRFLVKDTDVLIGPYYAAGSRTSGPRTYFRLARPVAGKTPTAPKNDDGQR